LGRVSAAGVRSAAARLRNQMRKKGFMGWEEWMAGFRGRSVKGTMTRD
jgi:hypothetical protein